MNPLEYKRGINSLKALAHEDELNPLRREVLKQTLLARLGGTPTERVGVPSRYLWVEHKLSFTYTAVGALVVLLLTGGSVLAAHGSIPGDTLYPVKRLTEKVELGLAVSAQAKAEVQAKHAEQRLDELSQLNTKTKVQVQPPVSPTPAAPSTTNASLPSAQPTEAEHRVEAATADTQDQLEAALNALNDVQAKLEVEGNTQAAAKFRTTFQNLKQRATPTFSVEVESNDHGRVKVRSPHGSGSGAGGNPPSNSQSGTEGTPGSRVQPFGSGQPGQGNGNSSSGSQQLFFRQPQVDLKADTQADASGQTQLPQDSSASQPSTQDSGSVGESSGTKGSQPDNTELQTEDSSALKLGL